MPEPDASERAVVSLRATAVAAGVLGLALASAWHWHSGFFNDDSLITIRCVENLLAGHGLVYNPGEPVLGVTTPLWAGVLAVFGWLGAPLRETATALGIAAFGWASAASVLLAARVSTSRWTHALAGGLVATSPLLLDWAGAGMETSAYVALLASFLLAYSHDRFGLLGWLGGALLLLRPDSGLFLAVAACHGLWRSRSWRPLLRVLPGFLVMVVPWVVVATSFYGSPLPNSGFAKSLQEEDWGPFLLRLWDNQDPARALLPFVLIGGVAVFRAWSAVVPLCLAAFLAGMHLGGMPGCPWYFPPAVYLATLLAALGAGRLGELVCGSSDTRRRVLAGVVVVAPFLGHVHIVPAVKESKRRQASLERVHATIGRTLGEIADPSASVAVDNIGYIGYLSGLRVVDMMGLVSDGVVEHLAQGRLDYAIRHHRPEYLAIWRGRGATPRYTPPDEWLDAQGYRVVFSVPAHEGKPDGPAYTILSRVEER